MVVIGRVSCSRPPGQGPGDHSRSGRGYEADDADGLADGGCEQTDRRPGGWGGCWSCRAVEADDGVEMDDPAPLVFGDLGIGDPYLPGERLVGQPGLAGQRPERVIVKRRHNGAAAQQNRLQAPSGAPEDTCRDRNGGQR